VLTGLYTIFGGMRAVAYTEALQTIIFIIPGLICFALAQK
jgi:SSS family solute:Na+ symporter